MVEGQQEQELAAGELGGHTGAHGGPFDDQGAKTGGPDHGKRGGKASGGMSYEDEDTFLSFSDESAWPDDADSGGGGGKAPLRGAAGGPGGGSAPRAGL